MTEGNQAEVYRFILDRIESVPHLEALLLLWRERPRTWTAEYMGQRLWVKPEAAKGILEDLARDQLIVAIAGGEEYGYESAPEMDRLLDILNHTYRHEMIRISNMIHSKASSAVREFARAFRFKQENE